MNIVITGTSRGIGRELMQIALRAGHRVLAVARQPDTVLRNMDPAWTHHVHVAGVDVAVDGAAADIAAAAQQLGSVDLLINNAGVLLDSVHRADFMRSFAVNAVAPFEITRALLPLLRRAAVPKVVHVTSRMGSVTDNGSGGHYAYRASKAALNMISRSLSIDNEWLVSLVVHPGWVRTDMGGAGASVDVVDSAAGIWRLAEVAGRSCSGRFFDYTGKEIPW